MKDIGKQRAEANNKHEEEGKKKELMQEEGWKGQGQQRYLPPCIP